MTTASGKRWSTACVGNPDIRGHGKRCSEACGKILRSSPSKCPFPWLDHSGHPQFLGPARVHIPNGISIGSAVFEGLTVVTGRGRPIDHATPSVAIGRIQLVLRRGLLITTDQSNLTKGRIAAAHGRYSYTLQWAAPPFSKLPVPMGDLDPHAIHMVP